MNVRKERQENIRTAAALQVLNNTVSKLLEAKIKDKV